MPTLHRFSSRQVHLDFHTSPHIKGIGADFDPDAFAATLERAGVDSVTCFGRCHHGLLYYGSKLNPERVHPHLANRDLLPQQIEACRRRGIRVPIYTTVQWDDFSADAHPEWLCTDEKGAPLGALPLTPGFYRFLDVTHPGYRGFLCEHVSEILRTLPVDGLFFDIVQPRPSLSRRWLDAMDDAGLDPESPADRHRFAVQAVNAWKLEMTEFIRGHNRDCTIFYNAGHVGPGHRATVGAYTHYELESLPSGGWGYLHFPMAMRYARGIAPGRRPCLGMTGKFHTSWGDFHSYKNEAALEFECFHALALGGGCSIGDQLHPSGRLDEATYDLIGGVYRSVAEKEPWCEDAVPVSEIAVITPEAFEIPGAGEFGAHRHPIEALGAVRMLQELRMQFDMVDEERDLSKYRLVILPDVIPVDAAFADRLEAFVASGGALLATARSGLTPNGDRFALPSLGVTFKGEAPFSPDFLVPGDEMSRGLQATRYVMYQRGIEVEPAADADVLARVETPYFNRTWRRFCSHAHTPSSGEPAYPAIVRRGRCVYFAHPIFSQYHANAPRWCRQLLGNAIDLLLGERLVEVSGPTTLLTTLNRQEREGRHVLHLLHYVPERRGQAFDTVEDRIPLHEVAVSVASPREPRSIRLVPHGEPLAFTHEEGRVRFAVPRVDGHAIVEIVP